MKIKEFN